LTGTLNANSSIQGLRGLDFLTGIYQFSGTAGQTVTVTLVSQDFDAYLYLVSPSGTVVAQDDDGGGFTNARIVFTLNVSGTWRVEATTFNRGSTGTYTLSLSGCETGTTTSPTPTPGGIALVCPVNGLAGALTTNSSRLGRRGPDYYTDTYVFGGTAGQTVTITLISGDFDVFMYLISPSGLFVLENDDGLGIGSNAQIIFALNATGTWQVQVTSFNRLSTGAYTLSVVGCSGAR